MNNFLVWAIIPASGIGLRMETELPKQYLKLSNKAIIEHTLDRLLSHESIAGAVVILSADDRHWVNLDYQSSKPIMLATGGKQRQHSVYNGLEKLCCYLQQDCHVLVHDAVRPLVSHRDISHLIETMQQHSDGALLAAPVADTLKQQNDEGNVDQTISRTGLWQAFTPQIFRASLLSKALRFVRKNQCDISDDASAIEAIGLKPKLVLGSVENIKITLPEDLMLARQIWTRQQGPG